MKCIVLVFLIHPILILAFSALAFMIPGASESITNPYFQHNDSCRDIPECCIIFQSFKP
jgi:K+-transporting ATPase A subunit